MNASNVWSTTVALAVTLSGAFPVRGADREIGDLRISYGVRETRHVNRVDGYPIALRVGVDSAGDGAWPELAAHGVARTSRLDEPGWRLGLAKRLWRRWIEFEAVWENTTDTNDRWLVGDLENLFLFLMNKKDYRDYYQRQGFRTGLRLMPSATLAFDVAYHNARYASLKTRSPVTPATLVDALTEWSFSEGERLAHNPSITAGRIAAVETRLWVQTLGRGSNPRSGWVFDLLGEFAGGGLGGDLEYILGELEIRRHQAITPRHQLDMNGHWSLSSRSLPSQRRRSLGGIGSIRGVQNRTMHGDRYALGGIDYTLFTPYITAHAFFDIGATWLKGGERNLRRGYGVGISMRPWPFRLYLAHGSREPEVISRVIFRMDSWSPKLRSRARR